MTPGTRIPAVKNYAITCHKTALDNILQQGRNA